MPVKSRGRPPKEPAHSYWLQGPQSSLLRWIVWGPPKQWAILISPHPLHLQNWYFLVEVSGPINLFLIPALWEAPSQALPRWPPGSRTCIGRVRPSSGESCQPHPLLPAPLGCPGSLCSVPQSPRGAPEQQSWLTRNPTLRTPFKASIWERK